MPFHNIARTHTERKQVREFWEDMRKEAEKIHKDYTDIKEDKYHKDFYKRIHNNEKSGLSFNFSLLCILL